MEEKTFAARFVGPIEIGDWWIVEGLGQSFKIEGRAKALALESLINTACKIEYERGFERAYSMKDGSGNWNFTQPVPGIVMGTPKNG